MKNKFLVLVLIGLFLFTSLSFAQMKPQISSKTYWCAKVEDILIRPEKFSTADQIGVGVRIKLWSQTHIPGVSGLEICNCAVEPKRIGTDYYHAVMSLRLIGLKYSETETNLLEYGGPTPAFPPYEYSGFPVIGFVVTNRDIQKGYIEVWGWAPKKRPLKDNREFTIYATLDAKGYPLKENGDPDYLKKGCFPPHDGGYEGDFRKTFKPRELQVPRIDSEKIKKGLKMPELADLKIEKIDTYYRFGAGETSGAVIFSEIRMKISVKNAGNADISKYKILVERKWDWPGSKYYPEKHQDSKWDYENKWGYIENGLIEVENLKPGETKDIFVFADNAPAPKADCWFRITLDPYNEIAEWDENNNQVSEIFFQSYYNIPPKKLSLRIKKIIGLFLLPHSKSPIRVRVYCDGYSRSGYYEYQWIGKPLDFEIEQIPTPDGKLEFDIWVLHEKDGNYSSFDFDGNGRGIQFVYDVNSDSFSGDVSGKKGESVISKGKDGTIEFIFLKFKPAPAKAK